MTAGSLRIVVSWGRKYFDFNRPRRNWHADPGAIRYRKSPQPPVIGVPLSLPSPALGKPTIEISVFLGSLTTCIHLISTVHAVQLNRLFFFIGSIQYSE